MQNLTTPTKVGWNKVLEHFHANAIQRAHIHMYMFVCVYFRLSL